MISLTHLESHLGEHIHQYVERLIKRKEKLSVKTIGNMHEGNWSKDGGWNGAITGEFNGVKFYVTKDATQASLLQYFDETMDSQREAYKNSDEYKKKQKEEEKELLYLNRQANTLVSELQTLDFSDYQKVLFWVNQFQPYSNRTGVNSFSDTVLKTFAAHGYEINAYTGEAFDENNPEKYARYIIGQALDGISLIGAMHPLVESFTTKWKEKFAI